MHGCKVPSTSPVPFVPILLVGYRSGSLIHIVLLWKPSEEGSWAAGRMDVRGGIFNFVMME